VLGTTTASAEPGRPTAAGAVPLESNRSSAKAAALLRKR